MRVQLGWVAFGKPEDDFIPQNLKTKVFNHRVLPILAYSAGT